MATVFLSNGIIQDGPTSWALLAVGLVYLGLGALYTVAALRSRGRPAYVLDAAGITAADGRRLHTWDRAECIWIGYAHRRWLYWGLRTASIHVYGRADIAFAQRAGTRVRPRWSARLPTSMTAGQISATFALITTVPVVSGDSENLKQLERRLTSAVPLSRDV